MYHVAPVIQLYHWPINQPCIQLWLGCGESFTSSGSHLCPGKDAWGSH